ncbi:glycosyltransferase family 61 protein [Allorhizobium pseudoryzae]|uniref:glycosyltransferase family 61 protein n=1 Tax=Allorhizobium pseudoryzae TaxID=379684 RepID=UPI003D028EFE
MDVASFLCTLTWPSQEELERKYSLLRETFTRQLPEEQNSVEEALLAIPQAVLNYRLGRSDEDAFFTPILAIVHWNDAGAHIVESAFFNRVVLQLTYQIRFQIEGILPEVSLFIGSPRSFSASMIHANNIMGVRIPFEQTEERSLREWEKEWERFKHIELCRQNLHECALDQISDLLRTNNRTRVGSVLVDLDHAPESAKLTDLFSNIESLVGDKTIYGIVGAAEPVLAIAKQLEDELEQAIVYCRTYREERGNATVTRAMLVAWNIKSLPPITLRSHTPFLCTVVDTKDVMASATEIPHRCYRDWEHVVVKPPVYVESSAPLLPEITAAISGYRNLYHGVTYFEAGAMFTDGIDYRFLSKHGLVPLEAPPQSLAQGDLMSESAAAQNGSIQAVLRKRDIRRIRGAALVLAFQPTLHQFFSHFLIQCFPRLLLIEELGLKDIKVVVPEDLYRKQVEMLVAFGVPYENIVFFKKDSLLFADELIVPYPWDLMFSDFTSAAFVRLKERMGIRSERSDRRILISRDFRKTWRNQVSAETVQNYLIEHHQCQLLRPEKLSLREEIEVYSSSRLIVGAEGAGLYSAGYSGQGTAVVSFSDGDYAMPILGSLAQYIGFDVAYYFGISMRAEGDMSRRPGRLHCDYVVDPWRIGSVMECTLDVTA